LRKLILVVFLGAVGLGFVASPVVTNAQELPAIVLDGRIVDAISQVPVSGVVARVGPRLATVSNKEGHFSLTLPPSKTYALQLERLGYSTLTLLVAQSDIEMGLTVSLHPIPMELERLEVSIRDQFQRRRHLSAREVSVIDAAAIAEKGGVGVELLQRHIPLTRGCFDESGDLCFGNSWNKTLITLCIDDQPAFEGTSELERLRSSALHSIELFDSGRHVRVYTRRFIREVLSGRQRLRPLDWCVAG